jgi:hypothetical protein
MYCSQCGKEHKEGAEFCASCGEILSSETTQQTTPPEYQGTGRRSSHSPKIQYKHSRCFPCTTEKFHGLLADLKNWLISQNFNCQQLTTEDGGTLLQVAKKGGWRKIFGTSTALNIVLHQSSNNITVEIGAGRWLDKAAVGAASILWLPLFFTAGFGAWQQMKLPNKIYQYISEKCNNF